MLPHMAELVAIALPGGPEFVEAVRRVWDNGDAFMPVDGRLPLAERQRVFDALSPSSVIGSDGAHTALPGGQPVEPGDAVVLATSGTTGLPKGVVHTHASVAASAAASSAALGVDPTRDRWLACLPLAHIGGLSVVMRSIVTGTPLEVHDGFHRDRVLDAAARGATLVSLVTKALLQVSPARFRMVLLGGAAPPADRPANVVATYGMTETGSGIVYNTTPIDGVEICIVASGEVMVRGPMLLRCYRDGTDPRIADGWFPTGDLGGWGDDGRLMIHGRRGDVIVTGGEKVWPSRAETILERLAGVAEVALVGRPHAEWGHEVVALVVPTDGAMPPRLEELRDAVKAELPGWYAPQSMELRAGPLPRTSLGKIQRNLLS